MRIGKSCPTDFALVMAHIQKTDSCWLWTGAKDRRGYSRWQRWRLGKGPFFIHRLLWEWTNGPIPDGLELDHLCRVHNCVNPDHLEPVTHSVNMLRGRSHNAIKTHCPQGHRYDRENTRFVSRSTGTPFRQCLTCVELRNQQIVARRQAGYPSEWLCRTCGRRFTKANYLGRHLRAAGHGRYEDYLADPSLARCRAA